MWIISGATGGGGGHSGSKQRFEELSRESIIINEALSDSSRRKLLISELAKQSEEQANLIRLYQYCKEYRATGQSPPGSSSAPLSPSSAAKSLPQLHQQRTALGRKITASFLQGGSMYEVKEIDHEIRKKLLETSTFKAGTFDELHSYLVSTLENSDRIVRTAQKIGVIHSTVIEAIKVMSTVEDDKRRRMLINELVVENLKEAHDLRFFQACKEYKAQKDPKKMAAMGRKLISIFIEAGSLHELQNLDEGTRKILIATKRFTPTTFDEAAEKVLNTLENSSSMVQAANKIGVVESSILSATKASSARNLGATMGIDQEVFERMINNPLLASEFEVFVRDEYIDEIWKFRTDVNELKFSWNEMTEEQRRGKASQIFEQAVKAGATDEINISGTMKDNIENVINKSLQENTPMPSDVFDAALKEMSTILLQNINYRVMNAVKLSMQSSRSMSSDDSKHSS